MVTWTPDRVKRLSDIPETRRIFVTIMPHAAMLRIYGILFTISFLLLDIPVAIPSKIRQSVFIEYFLLLDHVLKVSLFLLEEIPFRASW